MRAARRIFLGGQSVSLLGDGCAVLAVPLLVLQLTRDPLIAGLAAAPRGVGYLLVGLPAGPIVDRLNPWALLIAMDVARAAVFVALSLLSWLGTPSLWPILGLAFLAGAATVFFDAALAVAVKDLFSDHGLLRANSVLETAGRSAQLLGPAVVATLVATVGIEAALLVNAATFGISLLSLLAMSRTEAATKPSRPLHRHNMARYLGADFAAGVRFLLTARPLLVLTAIQTLINFWLAADTLLVFFARVTLALPVSLVSVVVAAGGLGGIAGAVMSSWLADRIRVLPLIASAVAVVAGALLLMAVSVTWWTLGLSHFVLVWAVTIASVVNRSTRQSWTPRDLLGRVTTTVRALYLTATPLGAAVAGAATHSFGDNPRPTFLTAGVLTALTIGVGWFAALRRYDAAPPPTLRT